MDKITREAIQQADATKAEFEQWETQRDRRQEIIRKGFSDLCSCHGREVLGLCAKWQKTDMGVLRLFISPAFRIVT
jgi:hypothetical protein